MLFFILFLSRMFHSVLELHTRFWAEFWSRCRPECGRRLLVSYSWEYSCICSAFLFHDATLPVSPVKQYIGVLGASSKKTMIFFTSKQSARNRGAFGTFLGIHRSLLCLAVFQYSMIQGSTRCQSQSNLKFRKSSNTIIFVGTFYLKSI